MMGRKMKQLTNNERGSALLFSLMILSMMTLAALMAVESSNTDIELSFNEVHEEQAFYVAEAGLQNAFAQIDENIEWRIGFDKWPFGEGTYTVTVIDSTDNATLIDTVILQSEGEVMGGKSSLELWLIPGTKSFYRYAAFGENSLLLENYACTDSYNSDSGTYAATQDTLGGNVGSNGTALLKNNVTVGGNLSIARSGGITFENSAEVLGDTTSTASVQTFDLASDSDYDWAQNNNSAPAGIIGNDYDFDPGPLDFSIKANKEITLTSGTYFFTSLSLQNNADIRLAPGAEVQIYVTGDILFENNTTFNEDGIPGNLTVFTRGAKLNFKNRTEFRGTIYAPNCDFMHENNADLYGSIIARSVSQKNNTCIHYDRSLADKKGGFDGTMTAIGWKETY